MEANGNSRKRKAVVRDPPSSDEAAIFDEFGNRPLNDVLHDDDSLGDSDSSREAGSEVESDGIEGDESDEIESVEVPSDVDEASRYTSKFNPYRSDLLNEEQDNRHNVKKNGIASDSLPSRHENQYSLTTDAHGNPRYLYPEIDPVYDSDDSDAPQIGNTIGNIPLSFYESYPHIGYDIDGRKVMRPAKGAALDSLLDSIEIPKGWTGLTDPATGKPLELDEEELAVLKRLTRNEVPEEGYDPYPDMVEYFSGKIEPMPLSAAPEPKRRFVPSKHEAKRVMKMVKAIKEGRIEPYRPPTEENEQEFNFAQYDLWAEEIPRPDHPMNMPAPKLPPPTYDESYHPPPEYLPDEEDRTAWQDTEEEERDKDYLPSDYNALRKVPGFGPFVKEKFERCLDLYLAPRIRRSKLNIDPESLLPKLPRPEELLPFPRQCFRSFEGSKGRVRSVSVHPAGSLLASGGDDGFLRLWDLLTGHLSWKLRMSKDEAINVVRWRPGKESMILAVAVGNRVYLLVIPEELLNNHHINAKDSLNVLSAGRQIKTNGTDIGGNATRSPGDWAEPESHLRENGVEIQITVRSPVKVLCWHKRGEHFATVSPAGQSSAVAIHTLSKHLTQLPLSRPPKLPQCVQFHPSKPMFFVADQQRIKVYDLARQEHLKTLQTGSKWISSFDVHPNGDNLVVSSYDKRLLWIDMDLSNKPYKTLRYHGKAIRSVKFHQGGYPLFVDASDDGTLQVFHGKVFSDLMENVNIVPLKVLHGHGIEQGLGVLDLDWHPERPWCVSAGADGTCRLWE